MADFVESNSLIATNEVGLAVTAPPVRGSSAWLAALSDEVSYELSDSLTRRSVAKKAGDRALLELDAVIENMRSHTRLSQGRRSRGDAPSPAFKPSALAAPGLKAMAVEVSLLSEPAQLSEAQLANAPLSAADSVRASWPVNWSVLKRSGFQMPRLKTPGSPSPSV